MPSLRSFFAITILALGLGLGLAGSPAQAGPTDPLFINLTSEDGHRINMALNFGGMQLGRGHPLTIFMNDRAVLAVSKVHSHRYSAQQKTIADLIAKGATIIVCPMCMQHYGVSEADLVPGALTGTPERTGNALFQENAKSLTW
jgi:intracellular sulfur oxidation DsrE/DsrF family protein